VSQPPTPPGWYVDPLGLLRWWDGYRWTPYTAPAPVARRPPAPPRPPQPIEPALITPGTLDPGLAGRVRTWQVVLVVLAALAVIVTVTWLLAAFATDPRLG
jgi:hypothetical protein